MISCGKSEKSAKKIKPYIMIILKFLKKKDSTVREGKVWGGAP